MALQSSTVWEVRTTGNDANGGGFAAGTSGTDYSQQDAAQVAYTDLVIGATTTQLTSAANPFTAAHVGNTLNVTGGATFTAGRYQVISVAGTTATMDRSVGTAGGAGTGNLGGALATPGLAAAQVVAKNLVFIKAGTYTCSATANVSGGRPAPAVASRWIGYVAARGDATYWGTMPSLKAGASTMTVFTAAAMDISVENLEVDGQAPTYTATYGFGGTGSPRVRAWNCRAKNMTNDGFTGGVNFQCHYCEAINCGYYGFNLGAGTLGGAARGCLARGGTAGFYADGPGVFYTGCVAYGNSSDGFRSFYAVIARGCSAISNGGDGFQLNAAMSVADSCVAYGNTGVGFASATSQYDALILNCAAGSNTGGSYSTANIPGGNVVGLIPLSANPFVGASGLNFALNNTAGGGALLRGGGFGMGPGSATTGYPDVGAVQHQDNGVATSAGMSKGRLIGGF